jgi:replication factor C small subunit
MTDDAMRLMWTEKYRPKKLDEVVGQDEIVDKLKSYVRSRNPPHLLFAGPAGTGKTASAIALAREMFKDNWKNNFYELNASDERGIDVVRTKIKDYARTSPIGQDAFKVIFLDEADALTSDAQAALRRTMERYSTTCRFILSCNYSSRIIEPIQSRCAVFRFRSLKQDDIKKNLKHIAQGEGIEITSDGLDALVYIAGGDMRKAINSLQVAASTSKKVDSGTLYKTSATARPEEIKELIATALEGKFMDARESLDRMLIEYGLSGEDIIGQVHRSIFELAIPDEFKLRLIESLGEVDYRLVEGSNSRIQLEALLAQFSLIGQQMKEDRRVHSPSFRGELTRLP